MVVVILFEELQVNKAEANPSEELQFIMAEAIQSELVRAW